MSGETHKPDRVDVLEVQAVVGAPATIKRKADSAGRPERRSVFLEIPTRIPS